jgi:acyl-CoA thioester hydrolase
MTKETVDIEVRVRYAETDKMGVAYYANYFIWFEVGRAELCRQKGFSYSDLEALGYILVVTDAHCHYRNSARYDETILIRTRLKEINKRMVTFGYQLVKKGSEETLAEGETRHLSIGPSGKPKSLPEKFLNLLTS